MSPDNPYNTYNSNNPYKPNNRNNPSYPNNYNILNNPNNPWYHFNATMNPKAKNKSMPNRPFWHSYRVFIISTAKISSYLMTLTTIGFLLLLGCIWVCWRDKDRRVAVSRLQQRQRLWRWQSWPRQLRYAVWILVRWCCCCRWRRPSAECLPQAAVELAS